MTKDDIGEYFTDIKQFVPKLTEYACMDHQEYSTDSPCAWWLRMPEGSDIKAPFVSGVNLDRIDTSHFDSSMLMNSKYQVNYEFAVRPAIWIRK